MRHIVETRRAAERERASEVFLGGDSLEDTAPLLSIQAAFVSRRFGLDASIARLVAEHAYAQRPA